MRNQRDREMGRERTYLEGKCKWHTTSQRGPRRGKPKARCRTNKIAEREK